MRATELFAEDDEERFLGQNCVAKCCVLDRGIVPGEVSGEIGVAVCGNPQNSLCLSFELDLVRIRNIESRAIEPHVGAQVPGEKRMLFGWVAADEQNRRSSRGFAKASGYTRMSREGTCKCSEIRGALVVDVVGLENGPRKLLQQVVLFVGGAI